MKNSTTGTGVLHTTSDMIGTLRSRIITLLVIFPRPQDNAAASVNIMVVSVMPAVVCPAMPALANINMPTVAIIIPAI
ncbi:hypothetical protein D3C80_1518340 [compost metagenome]